MQSDEIKNVQPLLQQHSVVRCFGSEVFYKLIADYIGNTQPIGYVFKSNIGEYYDRFSANFARASEQDWKDYQSSIEK